MSTQQFQVTGSQQDIDAFVRALDYVADVEAVSVGSAQPVPTERFGHADLVQAVVDVGSSLASAGIIAAVTAAFDRFKQGRSRVSLEPTGPASESDHAADEPANQ